MYIGCGLSSSGSGSSGVVVSVGIGVLSVVTGVPALTVGCSVVGVVAGISVCKPSVILEVAGSDVKDGIINPCPKGRFHQFTKRILANKTHDNVIRRTRKPIFLDIASEIHINLKVSGRSKTDDCEWIIYPNDFPLHPHCTSLKLLCPITVNYHSLVYALRFRTRVSN